MFSWTLLQVRHFRLDNIERRDFRRDERINQMFLCFGVVCKPYNVYLQVQIQTYKRFMCLIHNNFPTQNVVEPIRATRVLYSDVLTELSR